MVGPEDKVLRQYPTTSALTQLRRTVGTVAPAAPVEVMSRAQTLGSCEGRGERSDMLGHNG